MQSVLTNPFDTLEWVRLDQYPLQFALAWDVELELIS